VPRRIDDVYVKPLTVVIGVIDGTILGQNSDATLALDRVGVKNTFAGQLALAELSALAQKLINERGFAVVYVGDNRHIADLLSRHARLSISTARVCMQLNLSLHRIYMWEFATRHDPMLIGREYISERRCIV
jgi:hypothetical protein